jgi:hypothetical protein
MKAYTAFADLTLVKFSPCKAQEIDLSEEAEVTEHLSSEVFVGLVVHELAKLYRKVVQLELPLPCLKLGLSTKFPGHAQWSGPRRSSEPSVWTCCKCS